MILDKALLIKGLGGVAACTALGCGGTVLVNHYISNANEKELAELISKVGLTTCTITSSECSIGNSGLNLKQGDDKSENKSKQASSTGTAGKIKVYTDNAGGYNKGFRFVIEDGDISLADSKKLEQFETYEIKEDETDKKWYLTRKKDALEEKRRILGLPEEESCKLPSSDNKTCTLNEAKLKKINFKNKDANGASIVSGGSVTLTITKETTDTNIFTDGYKFSFQPTEEVTISTTPSNKIAKNSGTEFKIKKEGNTLTLEKAWSADALAKKAGLTSCDEATKTCELPTSESNLKLYNDNSDKVTDGKVADNTKKLKYEENAADHNQGFKFFAEQEINLANGNSSKKIETSSTATYEIKEHTEDSSKTWYLTKKTTTGGGNQ